MINIRITPIVLTFALIGCISSHSFASSVGDNIEPIGNLKLAVSGNGNFVFNKSMESGGEVVGRGTMVTKFKTEYSQAYGKVALGVTDYMNVYGKIGATTTNELRLLFTNGSDIKAKMNSSCLWGVGGTGAYSFGKDKDWIIGANSEYNAWQNTVDTATDVSPLGPRISDFSGKIDTWEFQITPYIAKIFNFLNKNIQIKPYTGLVWDTFRIGTHGRMGYTSTTRVGAVNRLELAFKDYSRQPLGIVVGTAVTLFKHFTINIEGRFVNETALNIGGSVKF